MGNGSRLLIHRPRQDYPKETPAGIIRENSREYGRSVVDFFKKNLL
jgi:hypothetical protein